MKVKLPKNKIEKPESKYAYVKVTLEAMVKIAGFPSEEELIERINPDSMQSLEPWIEYLNDNGVFREKNLSELDVTFV